MTAMSDMTSTAAETWEFTRRERTWLIDAVMVYIHQFKQVPENDLSELPELEALQGRLMNGERALGG